MADCASCGGTGCTQIIVPEGPEPWNYDEHNVDCEVCEGTGSV